MIIHLFVHQYLVSTYYVSNSVLSTGTQEGPWVAITLVGEIYDKQVSK